MINKKLSAVPLLFLISIFTVIFFSGCSNSSSNSEIIDYLNQEINQRYSVTELDTGELGIINKKGFHFTIHSYKVEGLGQYSTMTMTGFLGLIKMESCVITSLDKDVPLFNCDSERFLGKDILMIKCYDTMLGDFNLDELNKIHDEGKVFSDYKQKPLWYDSLTMSMSVAKKGRGLSKEFTDYAKKYIHCFLDCTTTASLCDKNQKKIKVDQYVDGLLTNGGVATDIFVKLIGQDATEKVFRKYIFGCE